MLFKRRYIRMILMCLVTLWCQVLCLMPPPCPQTLYLIAPHALVQPKREALVPGPAPCCHQIDELKLFECETSNSKGFQINLQLAVNRQPYYRQPLIQQLGCNYAILATSIIIQNFHLGHSILQMEMGGEALSSRADCHLELTLGNW